MPNVKYIKLKAEGAAANLFTPIFFASQLHLAHAASADGLAQDPLARLRGNGGARPGLFGAGRGVSRVGGAMGSAVRRSGSAAIVGDGRGRHFGVALTSVCGTDAGAPPMGSRGVRGPVIRGERWAISAGAALGLRCG